MSLRALRTAVPLLAGMLASCVAGDADRGDVVLRDSTGIQIVETRRGQWPAGREWRVPAPPRLEIGVIEGDPAYQLFRVTGATRLRDGRIVVANGGTSQLRVYDAEGRFVGEAGGAGEGPGEFRALWGIWPYRGDSLLAWDGRLRRVSIYDGSVQFGRSARLERPGFNPRMLGAFPDGSVVTFDEQLEVPDAGPREQYGVFARHGPEGAFLDSIARYPTYTTVPVKSPDGSDGFISVETFGARTAAAVAPAKFVVGTARDYELRVHSPGGLLVRLIRWRGPDRTVRAEDVAKYREEILESARNVDELRLRRAEIEQTPVASEFPAHRLLHVDRSGNLWVESYPRPGESGPRTWTVFDAAGRMLGDVALPERLWIFEIGEDYVLGVERDELDVEHVRLYSLVKP